MNKFIMWSFPLIVLTVMLTATVSKPVMPHIRLVPFPHNPDHIEIEFVNHFTPLF